MQTDANLEEIEGLWVRYPVKKDFPILIVLLLLTALLRFNGLNEPGMWVDEVAYTIAAQSPIFTQITNAAEAFGELSSDPSLSALPFALSVRLGISNYIVRYPAALFGILSVALFYRLGRTLFGNVVGLTAAFLLCISSFHILYSQEARNYSQFIFFSVGSFWFLYRAAAGRKKILWGGYILFTFGAVSTNHLMAFAIFVQGCFILLVTLLDIFRGGLQTPTSRRAGITVAYFALSVIAVYSLRGPWWGDFVNRRCTGCSIGSSLGPFPDLLARFIQSVQVFSSNQTIGISIFVILYIAGLIIALYKSPKGGLLLAVWLLLSIPLTTTGLWFISQFFNPRYTIWGLPAFFMAAACGLVGIVYFGRNILLNRLHFSKPVTKALTVIAFSLALILLVVANLNQIRQHPALKQSWPRGQLQEAANLIISSANSHDAVIAIGMPARYLRFYIDRRRQDLNFVDQNIFVEQESALKLPTQLPGRWYVLHNSYSPPNIPDRWKNTLEYNEFFDIVVVHLPNACAIEACLDDTKTLLTDIAEVNPNTHIAETANNILTGLRILQPH